MKKIANKSIPLFQLEESHLESKYRSEGFTYMIVNGYEVERVEERLTALPITAEFRQFVRGKSAFDEIEELVTALQVSVLVIGLRKRSPVGKLLLGSMAQEILLNVECPVLAVKATA